MSLFPYVTHNFGTSSDVVMSSKTVATIYGRPAASQRSLMPYSCTYFYLRAIIKLTLDRAHADVAEPSYKSRTHSHYTCQFVSFASHHQLLRCNHLPLLRILHNAGVASNKVLCFRSGSRPIYRASGTVPIINSLNRFTRL